MLFNLRGKISRAPSRLLFILTGALALSGCQLFASLTIKDKAIYADEGALGAFEAHTLTSTTAEIPKADWDRLRTGMLCMSADDFADYKANEGKACSLLTGGCTYEQQQEVHGFFVKMAKLYSIGQRARQNQKGKKK